MITKNSLRLTAGLLLAALFVPASHAAVRLPAIFSQHMVLQRSASTPIWGWADPGEDVSVSLNGLVVRTKADGAGDWMARLDVSGSPLGPFAMEVCGTNKIVIPDVVIGEVWLASGQSNMEWLLKNARGAAEELASPPNPFVRQFRVAKASVPGPAADCNGVWTVAGPADSGMFSAVAYYFAKTLQAELQVPIGVINSSWGGSPAEAWISREGLAVVPELQTAAVAKWKRAAEYPALKERYLAGLRTWLKASAREDHPLPDPRAFAGQDVSGKKWIPLTLPGPVATEGLPATGALWLRKEVVLPEDALPEETFLVELGEIDGFERAYWNGKLLLETTPENFPGAGFWRRFAVPASEARKGVNVLAIRLYAPEKPPRFLIAKDMFKAGRVPLAGPWHASAEYELPPPAAGGFPDAPRPPAAPLRERDVAAHLFNGMINPLIPYGIRGVIWYQGEANANRAQQYQTTFPVLIQDWRRHWDAGELPFYFCQLPNFMAKKPAPGDSAWAELREAQSKALALPKTGQAVLIDLGDADDIHPRDKRSVAARLAGLALANEYGRPGPCSGPRFASMRREGHTLRVEFQNVGGGLVAGDLPERHSLRSVRNETAPLVRNRPGSQLEGFAISGTDRKWVWADAKVDGNSVIVSASEVKDPAAVRYAWADNPTANLYSLEGLPASPFRTDDFPAVTQGRKY